LQIQQAWREQNKTVTGRDPLPKEEGSILRITRPAANMNTNIISMATILPGN